MSNPPRPSLNPRSMTTGSHTPSPTNSQESAESSAGAVSQPPQRHASLSETTSKSRQQASKPAPTPAEVKRQFVATGNERVFPMRNVGQSLIGWLLVSTLANPDSRLTVQARPSTSRTKTTLNNHNPSAPNSPQQNHQAQASGSGTRYHSEHPSNVSRSILQKHSPFTPGANPPPTPATQFSNPFAVSFSQAMASTASDGTMSPVSSHPATTPGVPDLDAGFSPKMARRRSTAGWFGSQSSGKGKHPAVRRASEKVVAPDGQVYWKLKGEPPIEEEPLHKPGCIQSFGVLLALEEDEAGNFIVQQVSEVRRALCIRRTDFCRGH